VYHCIKKKRNEFFYNAGHKERTHISTSKNKTIRHYNTTETLMKKQPTCRVP